MLRIKSLLYSYDSIIDLQAYRNLHRSVSPRAVPQSCLSVRYLICLYEFALLGQLVKVRAVSPLRRQRRVCMNLPRSVWTADLQTRPLFFFNAMFA
jgi:hypothetical protein